MSNCLPLVPILLVVCTLLCVWVSTRWNGKTERVRVSLVGGGGRWQCLVLYYFKFINKIIIYYTCYTIMSVQLMTSVQNWLLISNYYILKILYSIKWQKNFIPKHYICKKFYTNNIIFPPYIYHHSLSGLNSECTVPKLKKYYIYSVYLLAKYIFNFRQNQNYHPCRMIRLSIRTNHWRCLSDYAPFFLQCVPNYYNIHTYMHARPSFMREHHILYTPLSMDFHRNDNSVQSCCTWLVEIHQFWVSFSLKNLFYSVILSMLF